MRNPVWGKLVALVKRIVVGVAARALMARAMASAAARARHEMPDGHFREWIDCVLFDVTCRL